MSETDRRTRIGDAALRILGTDGARGLTHRAVDAEAGLPAGSTSYYCRKRVDLMALTLRRHAELDHLELVAESAAMLSQPLTLDLLADLITARVTRWIGGHERTRLIARFELFLAVSREPELAAVLQEQRQRFIQLLEMLLRSFGAVHGAASCAQILIALVEGLLLEEARAGGALITPAELRDTVFAIISQSVSAPAGGKPPGELKPLSNT